MLKGRLLARVYGLGREGETKEERPYGIAGLTFDSSARSKVEAVVRLDADCYCVATLAHLWNLPVVAEGELAQGDSELALVYKIKRLRIAEDLVKRGQEVCEI